MSEAETTTQIEVVRNDLEQTRTTETSVPTAADGEVVVAIDAFGFTANNISYAVFGDMLGYWQFFPSEGEWGQIPTWGFADVVDSGHEDVPVGTRLFGYFPMASHLTMQPDRVDDAGLTDASPHRSPLPPAYNAYRIVTGDPLYDEQLEAEQMLLWPLFFTGFVLDQFLQANDDFGAETVVLSSASSKTAISTAHCLTQRGIAVTGLTSAGNVDLVTSLGLYDTVVTYDAVSDLAERDAVFVDFAGNPNVRAAVHNHYGDGLKHSSAVGGTHWDTAGDAVEVPGPEPVFFFAPDHWGPAAEASLPDAWRTFVATAGDWLQIVRRSGVDAVESTYLETLRGAADPSVGVVLSVRAR